MLPAFSRRALVAALALAALARPARPASVDPVFTAIDRAKAADDALTLALTDLDEDDAAAMRVADEAADLSSDAFDALRTVRPITPAGFRALVAFYAEEAERNEPHCSGGLYLRHVLAALPPTPS